MRVLRRQTQALLSALVVTVASTLGSCSSSNGIRCSFANPAHLAESSWPKFQRDLQNSGSIAVPRPGVDLRVTAQFRDPTGGGFSAGPVLGNGPAGNAKKDGRVYIGSSSGRLFALDSTTLTELPETEFTFTTTSRIQSTVLVATRQEGEVLFFGSDLGFVYGITHTGTPQAQVWPLNTGGATGIAPALHPTDGTVYATSAARALYGICPNGVTRFVNTSIAPVTSAPAVTPAGEVVYGGDDRLLRMERSDGFLLWSISLSAPLRNGPVIEVDTEEPTAVKAIYALDSNARLFKVAPNGTLLYAIPISSDASGRSPSVVGSPALAKDRLYLATTEGDLFAIDTQTGAVVWSWAAHSEFVASPVVLDHGDARTIVIGNTNGNLYLIEDSGNAPGAVLAVPLGAPIRNAIAVSATQQTPILFVADEQGTLSRLE